jgi:hypothetical protein
VSYSKGVWELSLAGVVFVVGLALWFRPVLGLLLFHRYRGPPQSGSQRRVRERVVVLAAVGCIVVAAAAATLLTLWNPWA